MNSERIVSANSVSERLTLTQKTDTDTGSDGFSLVELLITVALMGIIFAIASLSMTSMSRTAKLNESRDMLLADIEEAKIKSISGVPHAIFIVSSTNYTVRKLNINDSNFIRDGAGDVDGAIVSTVTMPSDMTITSPSVGTEVWFDRRGIPKTSTWQFSNPSFTLSKDGETRTITISRTGRVKYE